MKADPSDAPIRKRGGANSLLVKIIVILCGLLALAAWAPQHFSDAVTKHSAPKQLTNERPVAAPSAAASAPETEDPYLAQVNRMLGFTDSSGTVSPTIEWAAQQEKSAVSEKQTVFSDANYVPQTTINTVRMPRPASQPNSAPERNQPYVTVVKETRESCGFNRPGSLECRRSRAQLYKIHSRACLQGGDSQSANCRMAKVYVPTR